MDIITFVFGISELVHLLRLMGMSAPSLHIESTDSKIKEVTIVAYYGDIFTEQ